MAGPGNGHHGPVEHGALWAHLDEVADRLTRVGIVLSRRADHSASRGADTLDATRSKRRQEPANDRTCTALVRVVDDEGRDELDLGHLDNRGVKVRHQMFPVGNIVCILRAMTRLPAIFILRVITARRPFMSPLAILT